MAYEGVSNYCHSAYDWSVAESNPSIMYVQMGEETDSAYHVVFRSYTGTFVNFYVDKATGTTRMEEYVPTLDVRNDAGTFDDAITRSLAAYRCCQNYSDRSSHWQA